jgi:hypothetical protein
MPSASRNELATSGSCARHKPVYFHVVLSRSTYGHLHPAAAECHTTSRIRRLVRVPPHRPWLLPLPIRMGHATTKARGTTPI